MNIIQNREKLISENTYYEVPQGTANAIECLQGENAGKWFITLAELEQRNDITPNEGECYLVTHIHASAFAEAAEPEPEVLDLRAWELQVVEPAVKEHILSVIRPEPYDYTGFEDIPIYKDDPRYTEEVAAIIQWIRDCWDSMEAQIENLEAPIELEVIIQNLPDLTL